jgi:hypothetical protein
MEKMYNTIKRRNSLDEKWKLSILNNKQATIINLQKKLNTPEKTSGRIAA